MIEQRRGFGSRGRPSRGLLSSVARTCYHAGRVEIEQRRAPCASGRHRIQSARAVCVYSGLLIVGGCTIHDRVAGWGTKCDPRRPSIVKVVNHTDTPWIRRFMWAPVARTVSNHLYRGGESADGLGLAGLGLVEAGKDASFTVACDPPVFIGNPGRNAYGDNLDAPLLARDSRSCSSRIRTCIAAKWPSSRSRQPAIR